jgi:hypothetical protein
MSAHLKYWQRNGTRRPLPSLWEAVQAYGRDNVYFDSPKYVDDRYCPWCGKLVTNKRRTYCTDECRQSYANMTVWHRGRGPYSLRILFRDNFTCQDCGEFHAHKNTGYTFRLMTGNSKCITYYQYRKAAETNSKTL